MIEMTITCDNAYHDRGHGVCSFCVQKRIDVAVEKERERLARLVEAPVEGVRALAVSSGDAHGIQRATANALEEAAKAIRESGAFLGKAKDVPSDTRLIK